MHDVFNKDTYSEGFPGPVSRWTSRWASRWKVWSFNALYVISSREVFRRGPRLLLKLAFGVAFYVSVTYYIWYSAQISTMAFGSTQANHADTNMGNNIAQGNVTGGLRMVVFGGGDVATPTHSSIDGSGQGYAWTEVMCRKVMIVPTESSSRSEC